MDYIVTGADGKEYGPVTIDELKSWAQQDRVRPDTPVKHCDSGQYMRASAVPGLFPGYVAAPPSPAAPASPPPTDWSQPPTAYPRGYGVGPQASLRANDGRGVLVGVIIRSALALLFFFVFRGLGLIVAGYGLFYAIQSKSQGHRFAPASLIIAGLTFLAILVGWILRLQGGAGF